MIEGNGDIAKALKDCMRPADDKYLFFASGVSNSQEKRESEYQREIDLLMSQNKDLHLVYFSTLAMFYSETRYTHHKRNMEKIVATNFPHYTIIRLGNISWGDNPNTIINYLRGKIERNESYEVKDEYRYVIDLEEFQHWIDLIPSWNCEMNLPGRMMKVAEIVKEIEASLSLGYCAEDDDFYGDGIAEKYTELRRKINGHP